MAGSWPLKMAEPSSSSSELMAISPMSAFLSAVRLLFMRALSFSHRSSSCTSTTKTGVKPSASSSLRLLAAGRRAAACLAWMSVATLAMYSSRVIPPPPAAVRGCRSSRSRHSAFARVGEVVDLGVGVEAEDVGRLRLDARHGLDELRCRPPSRPRRRDAVVDQRARLGVVVVVEVEGLEGVEEEVAQVLLHVGRDHAAVHVVGDAAAVHDLAHEVAQRVPRDVAGRC